MTLRNLLILASIFSLALANTLTADLPFMLFASDNITKMTASAPFCMFVASMPDPTYVNTSKIVFTSADSSISVKSLISEHPYYLYNMIPEFGMRCFETKELEIDYGGVFDDIDGTFAEWHSIIFYFIAKDKVEGPCKGKGAANLGGNINVMYWGSSEISASSECPAVILIPTNENGLFCSISEVVTQNSIDQIPESGVDVFLILSRKNSMNKTHFLSYNRSSAVSMPNFYVTGTAYEIRTTESSWQSNVSTLVYYSFFMGAQNVAVYKCEIFERFTVNRTFPRLTTDPSGSESFKFQVEHVNNTGQNLTLHIKPYNESCMSLKIEHSDLGKTNGNPPKTVTKTLKNPQGDVEFSGSFELQVKYFRYIDSEGCDPATDAFLDIETTWTSMAVKKMPVLVFIMIVLMAFL